MKKFLVFIIASLMALSLMACGGDEGTTTVAATTEAAKTEALKLVDAGATEFKIIYPEICSDKTKEVAEYLKSELKTATGAEFKASEDMAVSANKEKKEILIGLTDREESSKAITALGFSGDYSVKIDGNKIVISAFLDDCLQAAAEKFVDAVKGTTDYTLAADFTVSGSVENTLQYLPACSVGTYENSYDCGDDTSMLMYTIEGEEYKTYLTTLESNGFSKYTDNTIGDNYYATYVNEAKQVEVNLMNLPALKSLRISIEPTGYLPATSAETVEQVVTPSISMLGLEGYLRNGSANQIGMSFIFQTSNGHFIIFDGGHMNEIASGNIWNKLTELAPDKSNIVIDAWIITHAHADHMNAFRQFTNDHASDVTLKLMVVNLPSEDVINSASEFVEKARTNIANCVAKYPGCEQLKVHMGQTLYLSDAVVTCYGSYEMIAPQTLEYFNNSSTIYFVDLGGQRINMMADCGPLQSPVLTTIYGENLKSDIVQIDHHGYMGATSELYKAINPDYAFWPSGITAYNKYKEDTYNVWVINHVKKLWVAEDKVITENLPITY